MDNGNTESQGQADRLKFRPRARIIRTIGDQLISGPEAAVIELVKNAYDADASRVTIQFVPPLSPGKGRISILDDGHGMSLADVRDKWMEPATSVKANERHSPKFRRGMMGSKGIGRFAAAKLGRKLTLRSVSNQSAAHEAIIVGEIDWASFSGDAYLDSVEIKYLQQATIDPTGTEIEIRELSESWSSEKMQRLLLELRRLVSPLDPTSGDHFRIFLDLSACTLETAGFDGAALVNGASAVDPATLEDAEPFEVRPFPLLTACDYEVVGEFDGRGTFRGTMEIRRAGQAPAAIELLVPLLSDEDSCGPVGVRLFVFDREAEAVKSNMADAGYGQMSAAAARGMIDKVAGVAVYRGGFRVRPYGDSDNDWLTLDTRRVNNPSLRIGHNQIAGYLTVKDQGSSALIEKSSREGFEENGAFRRLRRLALTLLAERVEPTRLAFREKAGISRRVRGTTFDEVRQLAELKRLRKFALKLPPQERAEAEQLIDAEAASIVARIADLEDRHRILESRASLGSILAEVLHEGEPRASHIVSAARRLQKMWPDIVLASTAEQGTRDDFQKKLFLMLESGERLSTLFDALRPLAGGRRSSPPKPFYPTEPIFQAKDIFDGQNVPINVHAGIDAPRVVGYPEDLATAITNLIKNSIYWLKASAVSSPQIDIRFTSTREKLRIDVEDNGPGVRQEFVERIFDPGFTLRDGGTGLGLSIAREALQRSQAILGHDPSFEGGSRFSIVMERYRPGE